MADALPQAQPQPQPQPQLQSSLPEPRQETCAVSPSKDSSPTPLLHQAPSIKPSHSSLLGQTARASTRGYGHPSHSRIHSEQGADTQTQPEVAKQRSTTPFLAPQAMSGAPPDVPRTPQPRTLAPPPTTPGSTTNRAPLPNQHAHHRSHSHNHGQGYSNADYQAASHPRGPATPRTPGNHHHTANNGYGGPVQGPPGGPSSTGAPPSTSRPKVHKRTSIGPWDFVKSIGAGSMGQVKLAVNRYTRQPSAVKIVAKAATANPRGGVPAGGGESNEVKDARVIREAALGKLMHHPNIAQLYEIYAMTSHYYLVFEYIAGGQLLDYIITHGSVKETQARRIAREVASALAYCHKHSIVHRDLKIENILITDKGGIKLIDFGLANMFRKDGLLKTFCGSLYFAAPELLNATPYTGPEIDIWSFGVVLYVLVCGKVPFEDKSMSALHAKIKRGIVEYPTWLSPLCIDLLQRMLVVPPQERATMHEVLHHPWMNKGFEEITDAHLPSRQPLQLPLEVPIVQEMAAMQFGTEAALTAELVGTLQSPQYAEAVSRGSDGSDFSPLISLYALTRERMLRQGILRKPSYREPQQQQQQQQQQAQSPTVQNAAITPTNVTPRRVVTVPSRSRVPVPERDPSIQVPTPTQPKPSASPVLRTPQIAIAPAPPARATTRARSRTHGQFDAPAGSQLYAARNGGSTGSNFGIHESNANAAAANTSSGAQNTSSGAQNSYSQASSGSTGNASANLTASPSSQAANFSSLLRRLSLRRQRNRSDQTAEMALAAPYSENRIEREKPHLQFQVSATNAPANTGGTASLAPNSGKGHLRAKSLGQSLATELDSTNGASSGAPGMPSIEAPKQVSFKGFFSVQSTSTRPLPEIRREILRVLERQGIDYIEIKGGFACIYGASHNLTQSAYLSPAGPNTPVVPREFSSSIRRAHSRNNSINNNSLSGSNSAGSSHTALASPVRDQDYSSSQESIDLTVGGSDMLGHVPSRAPTPVRFEISIVRVPLLGLHGVQFKKISGNVWEYKGIAQGILEELHL